MSRLYVGRLASRSRERDLEDAFGKYGKIRSIDLKYGFAFVVRTGSKMPQVLLLTIPRRSLAIPAMRKTQFVVLTDAMLMVLRSPLCVSFLVPSSRPVSLHLCSSLRTGVLTIYSSEGARIQVEMARGGRGRGGDREGGSSSSGGGGSGGSGERGYGAAGVSRSEFRLIIEGLNRDVSWQDLKDHFRSAGDILFTDVFPDREGRTKGYRRVLFFFSSLKNSSPSAVWWSTAIATM